MGERVGGSPKKSGWGRRVSSGEKLATRIGHKEQVMRAKDQRQGER